MVSYLVSGGYAMWGVVLCGIVMMAMLVRAALRPIEPGDADAVLLWAGAAFGIGIVGTLVGISQVAEAMSAAGTAPASLVWNGISLALSTSIVGALLFVAGLVGWGLIRMRVPGVAGEGRGISQ